MNSLDYACDQFAEVLLRWHASNRRSFPWREAHNPYGVLVAEVLLQRTPAERVSAFYEDFLSKYPDPCSLARANPAKLEREVAPLGLVKRVHWLRRTAKIICEEFGGRVPRDMKTLLRLPGVGEYTAAAILSFGYQEDAAIVDVNVVRIVLRVFGLAVSDKNKTTRVVREFVEKLLPKGRGRAFNEALLDFAALVCKPRPLCEGCPLNRFCEWYKKNEKNNGSESN